jgi:hypothetical protein
VTTEFLLFLEGTTKIIMMRKPTNIPVKLKFCQKYRDDHIVKKLMLVRQNLSSS